MGRRRCPGPWRMGYLAGERVASAVCVCTISANRCPPCLCTEAETHPLTREINTRRGPPCGRSPARRLTRRLILGSRKRTRNASTSHHPSSPHPPRAGRSRARDPIQSSRTMQSSYLSSHAHAHAPRTSYHGQRAQSAQCTRATTVNRRRALYEGARTAHSTRQTDESTNESRALQHDRLSSCPRSTCLA
jgi:hypothetical protein